MVTLLKGIPACVCMYICNVPIRPEMYYILSTFYSGTIKINYLCVLPATKNRICIKDSSIFSTIAVHSTNLIWFLQRVW